MYWASHSSLPVVSISQLSIYRNSSLGVVTHPTATERATEAQDPPCSSFFLANRGNKACWGANWSTNYPDFQHGVEIYSVLDWFYTSFSISWFLHCFFSLFLNSNLLFFFSLCFNSLSLSRLPQILVYGDMLASYHCKMAKHSCHRKSQQKLKLLYSFHKW